MYCFAVVTPSTLLEILQVAKPAEEKEPKSEEPLEKEHSTATIEGFLSDLTKEEPSVEKEQSSSEVVDIEGYLSELTKEEPPQEKDHTSSKIIEFEGFLNDLTKETSSTTEGMFSSQFTYPLITIVFLGYS